jgi:transposase
MPPAYVKPYVKRQKDDSTDAEAICEAATRPNIHTCPGKAALDLLSDIHIERSWIA